MAPCDTMTNIIWLDTSLCHSQPLPPLNPHYKKDLVLNPVWWEAYIYSVIKKSSWPLAHSYEVWRGFTDVFFSNGPGDLGSVPGQVIPKTQKMVLDASLLNTQHYKVQIKGKVSQSWERSSALQIGVVAIEKGAFWSPSTGGGRQPYFYFFLSLRTIEIVAINIVSGAFG